MALLTVMLVIVFGLIFRFTQENLERESISMMESIGSSPVVGLPRPGERPDRINLPYFVVGMDLSGTIRAEGSGHYDLEDVEFLAAVLNQATEDSGTIEEYHLRYLWVNGMMGRRLVCADTTSEEATLEHLMLTCIGLGALSFFGFLALSLFLSGWALKPVKASWEAQKQFIADASHELKTPLTVILTNAELLQSPEFGPEERNRCADNVLQMSKQMRLLVERMLTLTRMDNNAANMVMAELDLSTLVSDWLLPFEPVFFERDLILDSRIDEGIRVTASRDHIRQVLEILLDNALKYSTPGEVVVKLTREGGKAILSVSNPGPEISKADRENIFKRFYRIDKARSRDGSSGLGLSIAQSIVQAHKGTIRAESQGGRNAFVVELP